METTLELLQKLQKKSATEIQYALFHLLKEGKWDFLSLQGAYVQHLEYEQKKARSLQSETEMCALELLLNCGNKKRAFGKSELELREKAEQRTLYLFNQHKNRFNNLELLNERFNYDEEKAKTLSAFEREKAEDFENIR